MRCFLNLGFVDMCFVFASFRGNSVGCIERCSHDWTLADLIHTKYLNIALSIMSLNISYATVIWAVLSLRLKCHFTLLLYSYCDFVSLLPFSIIVVFSHAIVFKNGFLTQALLFFLKVCTILNHSIHNSNIQFFSQK